VQDSARPTYGTQNFGLKTSKFSDGTPLIRIGYRQSVKNNISLYHYLSFGAVRIIKRYTEHTIPFGPAGEKIWNDQNNRYNGLGYSFRSDKYSRSFELGTSISFDFNKVSLLAGLKYFYFRNPPIIGHHGIYLNVGASVIF
jgi:hypothetical protein